MILPQKLCVVVIKKGIVEEVCEVVESRACWSHMLPSRKPDRIVNGEPVWYIEKRNRMNFVKVAKAAIDKFVTRNARENLYGFFTLCRLEAVLASDDASHWALSLLTQIPESGKAM